MAMDKINGSPLNRPGVLENFLGTARSAKDDKAETDPANSNIASRPAKSADTMEISEAAHKLVDLRKAVETGRDAIKALPEIRAEKVEEAQKRLRQGYYNSSEVQSKIADKLGSLFSKMDEI